MRIPFFPSVLLSRTLCSAQLDTGQEALPVLGSEAHCGEGSPAALFFLCWRIRTCPLADVSLLPARLIPLPFPHRRLFHSLPLSSLGLSIFQVPRAPHSFPLLQYPDCLQANMPIAPSDEQVLQYDKVITRRQDHLTKC